MLIDAEKLIEELKKGWSAFLSNIANLMEAEDIHKDDKEYLRILRTGIDSAYSDACDIVISVAIAQQEAEKVNLSH